MTSGILVIDKEKGYTSFDVVAKLRSILHIKKIGHTGTLDPDATGVLPVCIGKATKVCDLITSYDKVYDAVMLLGISTDTEDSSGNIIEKTDYSHITNEEIERAVNSFVGEYSQIPPMYSAKRIDGKRLYELAREGITVERKPVDVRIYSIDITRIDIPRVYMRIHCSKGTYIRTLCKDIGKTLESAACMEELRRIKSGRFDISDAVSLASDDLESHIIPIDKLFDAYKAVCVNSDGQKKLLNGNELYLSEIKEAAVPQNGETLRVYTVDKVFAALYEYNDGKFRLKKNFI